MLQFISDVLTSIADFFSTAFNFVISFFREVVYLIQLLASAMINMPSYFVWLPTTITVLITTALAIIVVYKILGRD